MKLIQRTLQSFPSSLMTCSELSAQKGTKLTKHFNLKSTSVFAKLAHWLKLMSGYLANQEKENTTVLAQELATDFHYMPDLIFKLS